MTRKEKYMSLLTETIALFLRFPPPASADYAWVWTDCVKNMEAALAALEYGDISSRKFILTNMDHPMGDTGFEPVEVGEQYSRVCSYSRSFLDENQEVVPERFQLPDVRCRT